MIWFFRLIFKVTSLKSQNFKSYDLNYLWPKVVFLGATDLTASPQTNRMRYHEAVFWIQLESKKAQAKLFLNFRDFFQKISKFEIFKWPNVGMK
jgi:hypothetical protein